MCSQIYSHPVEGYKCFANANKSQGTYYTCCDLDTREIKYVTSSMMVTLWDTT